ncbi:unnamed protein product [Rotaria sp. Silwood2]|nr:unnamed protein product [Rotaria sp. Silwood2]CAF3107890.1 unnamed protein product [Rotaria sp. Silwood2]CAF3348253.1 unnamed protein product [Rotaria sp. Silwood2]CAF3433665.1 unnamed protein product [Rotaria sp. Silwood2]CAF4348666.1 unnamed protein product [Rotaria sp. Silwood2]
MSSRGVEVAGQWKVLDYPGYPECVDCEISIGCDAENPNQCYVSGQGVNTIMSEIKYDSESNEWERVHAISTCQHPSLRQMVLECGISSLVCDIRNFKVENGQYLLITLKNNVTVRLQRL